MNSFNYILNDKLKRFIFSKKNRIITNDKKNFMLKNNQLVKNKSTAAYYKGRYILVSSEIEPNQLHESLVDEFDKLHKRIEEHENDKHIIESYLRKVLNYINHTDELYHIFPEAMYSVLPERINTSIKRDVFHFTKQNQHNNDLLHRMLMTKLILGD